VINQLYKVDQVAELLGVSARTVETWISSGELKAINVSRSRHTRKHRLRIREDDLEMFLKSREINQGASNNKLQRRYKRPDIPQYV